MREIHGYVQLSFGDKIGISIYNEISIIPEPVQIDELAGKMVTAVIEDGESIEFEFLDGVQLKIDMREPAYRGPEALQLNRNGLPPVIWN